ncbi:hypothetical protein [Streptomyces sp. NPDC006668]|uniref:hypothetical protein n=1 Tax=Streptomyces sp. NPDC006668 TaxID=3156903 RepID=UPI0033E5DC65
MVFTDELGGGGAATCNAAVGPNHGADGIYDIVGKGYKRKLDTDSTSELNAQSQPDYFDCAGDGPGSSSGPSPVAK